MRHEAVIQEAVRRIVATVQPERIILFGSTARGDHAEGSDVDLLVLVDQPAGHGSLMMEIYSSLGFMGVPIDVVVMESAVFERHKPFIGTLARPASEEGVVLYQRAA